MTRVLHTADTHVGYRQYHSPERRGDFLEAFRRVVADAVEADVDAVVHAGDVFHDRRPNLPDIMGTVAALRELAAADIPFLAVVGNHEDKREAQWLDLFEQLDLATRLDADGTVVGDVTLYGLDYVPASRREDLELSFATPETDHAALVAHGMFEPLAPGVTGDHWDTEALLERVDVDFDALLLGDNHHPDTARVDGTWVTYAGSTERVSADEEADRGYNLVTFDDGVDIARRGLPTRPFRFVNVELHEGEGVERVRERVRERDLEDAVVYVRVDGAGESFAPATVEEFATERGALVARVNDRRDVDESEAALDVSFADPDEAVRERVRGMGLSAAALDVDETVRESGLADSNVRDAVRDRVEALLEEDRAAFEPAEAGGIDEGANGAGAGEETYAAATATDGEDGATASVDDTGVTDSEGGDEAPPPDDGTGADGGEAADGGDAEEPDNDDSTADRPSGGQASVEDYL